MDARTVKQKMLLAAIALLAMGCNADPGARRELALMRAEIQDLEDSYYRLKSQYGDVSTTDPVRRSTSGIQWTEDYSGNRIEYPESGEVIYEGDYSPSAAPQFGTPKTEPVRQPAINPAPKTPEEIDISPAVDNNQSIINRSSPRTRSASSSNRTAEEQAQKTAGEDPADLDLIAEQTVPVDTNGDGKPDGIQATFSLRDQSGKTLSEPAKLIFSLLDPALPSGKQRIGFWEHSSGADANTLSLAPEGNPEQVFLPWQSGIPSNSDLLLFVRHTRDDGTALEGSTSIALDGPGGMVADKRAMPNDRSAKNSGGKAPEIVIDTEMLEKNSSSSQNRRPLWRATR